MQSYRKMFIPDIYSHHKLITKVFEWGLVGLLSIQAMESIKMWVSIISGSLAVVAGILLLIRTYWEIRVKRSEHRLKIIEERKKDQEFWESIEKKKNGTN